MKKFIYTLLVFITISCAKDTSKSMDTNDLPIDVMEETNEAPLNLIENSYNKLITEKLQDYLDHRSLAATHPDFTTTQISDSLELFRDKNVKKIQEIQFIEQPEILSDSITKLTTIVRFMNTSLDTIISHIKTSNVIIDTTKFKTSKVTFERLELPKRQR
ncbi:hypothetical protein [Aquimarina sp. RZ0]|uniref:hypothetical protein n=1 Tax=Aquimarina sp. RZ0 TaxID=2607730 RepID=UPI0011F0AA5A|nr:hypothetical protein [Aquimarina sp. RZ0]KAA1244800.1 hypothetical protein F0000_15040 [Aquimarina sp. RZ0]